MSKVDKALQRVQSRPKDYAWSELVTVMESLGYELKTTGGSARKFVHSKTKAALMMHEPHPTIILKAYQVAAALKLLKQEKHI